MFYSHKTRRYVGGIVTAIAFGMLASCNSAPQSAVPTDENGNPRDYTVPELVEMLVYSDGYEDEEMAPYYSDALTKIDGYCSERPQSVMLLAMKYVESQGDDGLQFATLNVLEQVVSAVENADSHPVNCAQLFE